jgi:hypothetical protein
MTPNRLRAIGHGLTVAGLLFAAYLFLVVAPGARTLGFDAYAYWHLDIADPYALGAGSFGAFTYTPVAARLFAPAAALSWPAFLFLWLAILVATVIWLGWRRALLVLAFPPVAVELYHGNIHLLMAAAIALGFRYPAAWAFVLLTKVTPGVGLLWFAVRREWRSLGIALGATAVVAVASVVVDGRLWSEWLSGAILRVAQEGVGQPTLPVPLALRLPAAALVVTWGGLTDRRWTVPAAATLALPVPWFSGLAILAALPALDRPELAPRARVERPRSDSFPAPEPGPA